MGAQKPLGLPERNRHWNVAESMDGAVSELNSAIVGAYAALSISSSVAHNNYNGPMLLIGGGFANKPKSLLIFKVMLPSFKQGVAQYKWAIHAVGKYSKKRFLVLSGDEMSDDRYAHNTNAEAYENKAEHREVHGDENTNHRKISGWVDIDPYDSMQSLKIEVDYWIGKPIDVKPLKIEYRMLVVEN